MLFCNLTPLDARYVNAIAFCRKSEFCEYITSLDIQHSIYVRQFEFFVFTMKRIASLFCNLSFAGQYRTFLQLVQSNNLRRIYKFWRSLSSYIYGIATELIQRIKLRLNKLNIHDIKVSILYYQMKRNSF